MKVAPFIVTLLLLSPLSAWATPISASVACAANACTITPNGGSVPVDNLGFSLEVDWSPQHIKLIEPPDDRVELRMTLLFDVTGTVSDVADSVAADALTLNEMGGVEIAEFNENFDDVTSFNPILRINFDIFGPDTGSTFTVHGFDLAMSSMVPLVGTIDSFAFREARLLAVQGTAMDGVWVVPEPGALGLLGAGLLGLAVLQRESKRRRPKCRRLPSTTASPREEP